MKEQSIVDRLQEVVSEAHTAVEAGERSDWSKAEEALKRVQVKAVAAIRLVELANDVQN